MDGYLLDDGQRPISPDEPPIIPLEIPDADDEQDDAQSGDSRGGDADSEVLDDQLEPIGPEPPQGRPVRNRRQPDWYGDWVT